MSYWHHIVIFTNSNAPCIINTLQTKYETKSPTQIASKLGKEKATTEDRSTYDESLIKYPTTDRVVEMMVGFHEDI